MVLSMTDRSLMWKTHNFESSRDRAKGPSAGWETVRSEFHLPYCVKKKLKKQKTNKKDCFYGKSFSLTEMRPSGWGTAWGL